MRDGVHCSDERRFRNASPGIVRHCRSDCNMRKRGYFCHFLLWIVPIYSFKTIFSFYVVRAFRVFLSSRTSFLQDCDVLMRNKRQQTGEKVSKGLTWEFVEMLDTASHPADNPMFEWSKVLALIKTWAENSQKVAKTLITPERPFQATSSPVSLSSLKDYSFFSSVPKNQSGDISQQGTFPFIAAWKPTMKNWTIFDWR